MKLKPSDINLGLEEKQNITHTYSLTGINDKYPDGSNRIDDINDLSRIHNPIIVYKQKDIHLRISELLNILEEHIDFFKPPKIVIDGKVIHLLEEVELIYTKGFRDGEEAHKKKVREVFLGK